MHARLLKTAQAAKLLLSILPVIRADHTAEIGPPSFDEDVALTSFLRSVIESKKLEQLLAADSWTRTQIARRIMAFALSASHDPKKVIARLEGDVDDRDELFAAMTALLHQAPFDYLTRTLEESRKRRAREFR
jgi:hypothetical protein